ncbi:glycosyltransferase [Candidatus Woesebacteria bacterium]|jgi:glycosyltransferase involved in cell wall biosynthesis|nr:glycosyltransferase [Candidatus Woesebacteria bacterium]
MTAHPTFSIIVVTKNNSGLLTKSIAAITRQSEKTKTPIEIIVIDSSPNEQLTRRLTLTAKHSSIHHVRFRKHGISLARNYGISIAKGRYICFIDDDTIINNQWLRILCSATVNHPSCIIFGQILPTFEKKVSEYALSSIEEVTPWIFTSVKASNPKSIWPYAVNVCIPRQIFKTHGAFSELFANEEGPVKHPYGEDPEFFSRVLTQGAKIKFEPNLICYHHLKSDRLSLPYLFSRYIDDGKNSVLGFIHETHRIHPLHIARFILRDLHTAITQNKWTNLYTHLYTVTRLFGECLMCVYLIRYHSYYLTRVK